MKILIDIGHPAHIHYFKNIAFYFQSKGSKVLFTTRDKEVTLQLLEQYKFNYINLGKPYKSKFGKLFALVWFTFRLLFIAIRFKPDLFLNATHYSAWVAFILRKPHIAIEDSFNMEQVRLYLPFTDVILSPSFPHNYLGPKEVLYNAYQELLYLHPNRFKRDISVLKKLGITEKEKYIIMRFVAWNASHDIGQRGMSLEFKRKLIIELSKYAKVYISSESQLPTEFEPYRLIIPPYWIHDLLYFASLFIGEGATMASEAAVLGTPAIYINSIERGYVTEAANKYGLSFDYRNCAGALEKAIELLNTKNIKVLWKEKLTDFYNDKIDPTAFFIWFIENYPESFKIMKENPDYQYNFR
jgi:uncharacterized protein